ncbi:hypothetical protein B4134_1429 [Bacillus safensis]|nr:hypothetical protein B4107_1252 [Bacillus safensis]KIL23186.1 hypothetical protein B4134_1429 [Bacillus safensis]
MELLALKKVPFSPIIILMLLIMGYYIFFSYVSEWFEV